jgi:hypothetical protein
LRASQLREGNKNGRICSINFLRDGTLLAWRGKGTPPCSGTFSFGNVTEENAKEVPMKKFALGLVAAIALFASTAVPAMSQVGVYAGPGGVGVQVGTPYYGYYGHPGWHRHYYHHGYYR